MTTSELQRRLEGHGMKFQTVYTISVITLAVDDGILATVSESESNKYGFSKRYEDILSEDEKVFVSDLVKKYAATPLEGRNVNDERE